VLQSWQSNKVSYSKKGNDLGPGTLLNEGSLIGLDVIVLLVKTQVDGPDFCGAAAISNAITKLIPGIYCDIGIFLTEGDAIETKLKQIRVSN
jgi:predicted ATP-grasp superfamily ATP-dependent carboligase